MRTLTPSIIAALFLSAAPAFAGSGDKQDNAPWYPSLQAFEHYDSGRSHVFSQAEFLGSFTQPNTVAEVRSADGAYSSGYNMSYLNENEAFIQGGSYGNVSGSIGPYVAKVDPQTLEPIWSNLLRNTQAAGEWDYPGGMAIMNDGYIYVVSGYRIYKVDPSDGSVVDTLVLPTQVYMPATDPPPPYQTTLTDDAINTSYNGINALPDGTIVVKSLYRSPNCEDLNGGDALLGCKDLKNVPQSVLITVYPGTVTPFTAMSIIDNITLQNFAGARPTITHYNGVDYVYLLENTSLPVRYIVTNGHLIQDMSWQPTVVLNCGQQTGGSLIAMNDWIIGATNTVPATGALTVFAIHQGDASKYYSVQPYKNDPRPPGLATAFQQAAPNYGFPLCGADPSATGLQAISWADMSLEADPENGLFYGVETLAREVAAFRIGKSGIETVWKQTQTTTEWATLIGPKAHRVWVGTDIPVNEIPGKNTHDQVVWRDARTGQELARSKELPNMTQGSAVQPGYGGSMFFPGQDGTLIKLTPTAVRKGNGPKP